MKLIPLLLSLLFPVFPFFVSSLHAQAPSWPADDGWLELRQGSDFLTDLVGDAQCRAELSQGPFGGVGIGGTT